MEEISRVLLKIAAAEKPSLASLLWIRCPSQRAPQDLGEWRIPQQFGVADELWKETAGFYILLQGHHTSIALRFFQPDSIKEKEQAIIALLQWIIPQTFHLIWGVLLARIPESLASWAHYCLK